MPPAGPAELVLSWGPTPSTAQHIYKATSILSLEF